MARTASLPSEKILVSFLLYVSCLCESLCQQNRSAPKPTAFIAAHMRPFKAEMYTAGEELFALKITEHPELAKTKKESCLLDQLYGLYMDVLQTLER